MNWATLSQILRTQPHRTSECLGVLAYFRLAYRSQAYRAEDDATMADEQPTQEMEPKFEALRQAIAGDVAGQVTRLGQQLRKELSSDMTQQVTSLGQQLRKDLSSDMTQQVTSLGQQLRKELSGDMTEQVASLGQQLRKELSDDMTQQVTSLDNNCPAT